MMPDLLLAFTIFYVAQIVCFAVAALYARYPSNPRLRPSVSVVIAARNEEQNITRCLDSIAALTYPKNLLEVIVVDDHSDDRTLELIQSYEKRYPFIRSLRALPGQGHLQGKTNAVTQGIDMSKGEIILFTDADCEVPADWVQESVKYYTDERIGTVAGFTELRPVSWFARLQSLDWFALFSVAAAVVRLGYPITAVGTNLSVRRKAYDAIGGYRGIPFNVTEDYALFHAVTNAGYRARFPMDPGTLVQSGACDTWLQLHRQKTRWFTGGRTMDIKNLAFFAGTFILNTLIVVTLFFDPGAAALSFLIKAVLDLIVALPALSRFKQWGLLPVYPLYQIYYFFYVLFYPPLVLLGHPVVWKERAFPMTLLS